MTNSRASDQLELIEKYETGTAEASHTFTFPAKSNDKYSALMLVFDVETTAALDLEIVINGLTGMNYDCWQSTNNGVSDAYSLTNNQTEWDLISATSAASLHGILYFNLNDASGMIGMHGTITDITASGTISVGGRQDVGSQTEFTILKLQCSTSTLQTGSKATLYAIKR